METVGGATNPNWTAVNWLIALGFSAAVVGTLPFNHRDLAGA